jgi:hypothetical protein
MGGPNERKGCFGRDGSRILLSGTLLDSQMMAAGGSGARERQRFPDEFSRTEK